MRYYQKVMRPDETLAFHTSVHWIVYWPAILFLLLAILAYAVKVALDLEGHEAMACIAAALVLAVLAVIAFLRAFLRRLSTEIVVTNHRVIFKRGLFSRHTVEMNVSKIETVDVEQTLWGRLFGYGNVIIRGTGGTFEPLIGVARPLQLRNTILVG
ncbi:MAG: PH domain-containing protein [Alphaproteobacteria bacterium]|nr:PH domain-containing protein [Alphaproteobacteria bacterium]